MAKTSESQLKASQKYAENNRDRKRYLNAKSAARGFIRNKSTVDDLSELRKLINEREEKLNANN